MSSVLAKASISSRVWGAYGILGLVAASHAMSHSYTALVPLINPIVMQEFNLNYSQIGLMLGTANMIGGVMQLAFGYLGRFMLRKTMLAWQNLILSLLTALTGLTQSYIPYLAIHVSAKIAMSPQHPVGNSIVTDTFGKKLRGSAVAINYAGGNFGAVVVPMIATMLILGIGWRWTMVVFALPGILIAALLTLLIHEDKSRATSGESSSANPLREVREILSSRTVVFIFLASVAASGGRGLGVVMNYVPLYLRNGLNLDVSYVGVLFTILMIGSVVGPLLAGRISDRRGRRGVVIVAYLVATASTSALTVISGESWLLPMVILIIGLASYSESSILQTFLADTVQRGSRDLAFGLYFAIIAFSGSLWASYIGYLVDTQGFIFAIHVMSASYVVAALLTIPTREQTE